MNSSFKVGDRVRVTPDADWHPGAQKALRGIGVVTLVTEIKTEHNNNNNNNNNNKRVALRVAVYAVTFDKRPEPWSANQIPSRTWWFGAHELQVLP